MENKTTKKTRIRKDGTPWGKAGITIDAKISVGMPKELLETVFNKIGKGSFSKYVRQLIEKDLANSNS